MIRVSEFQLSLITIGLRANRAWRRSADFLPGRRRWDVNDSELKAVEALMEESKSMEASVEYSEHE